MKAILVIDVPDSCYDCPLCYDYLCCSAKKGVYVYSDKRANNCPLKPMPQKKEVEVNKIEDIMHTEYSIEDIYMNKYVADIRLATDKLIALGYNKCIDEILGE